MYKMEISIGSYKVRLEILILIFIVFWVMFGHVLCGCCRVSMFEAMTTIKESMTATQPSVQVQAKQNKKEGFSNIGMAPEFSEAKSSGVIMDPSKWSLPTLTYSPGTTPDAGVQSILDRPKQPIPLPPGQMDMFATTPFKPECCPNTYSNSMGCACMTVEQLNFLNSRGANNVPYSEY
jgi:hypothetical protein